MSLSSVQIYSVVSALFVLELFLCKVSIVSGLLVVLSVSSVVSVVYAVVSANSIVLFPCKVSIVSGLLVVSALSITSVVSAVFLEPGSSIVLFMCDFCV